MSQTAIFQPVFALVFLTFLVLLRIPFVRIRAVSQRRVTVADFEPGESANVPVDVSLPNRNYMNLLELPMLFYVLAVTLFVTQHVDNVELTLGWLYVALRVAHSCVHLALNHVLTRLAVFAASNLTLIAMWTYFATQLL